MEKEWMQEFLGLLVWGIVLPLVFSAGFLAGRHTMREQAVERGCAQFNPTTGDWEWAHGKATNDQR